MAIRTFRCGSSSAVYYAPPVRPSKPTVKTGPLARADREPVRLRTRLHLGGALPVAHGFRVIATLTGGDSALVCLGATRGEVIAAARGKAAGLSSCAASLLLQQWVGGVDSGYWQTLPLRRGELGVTARRAPRRRRQRVDE